MIDSDFTRMEQLDSASSLMIEQRAECLLSVVTPMLHAMQAAQNGSVESALQLYESKHVFRDSVEALCRPLSSDETQQLLMLTLITLGERLTGQG